MKTAQLKKIPGQTQPLNGWKTAAAPPQIKQVDEWQAGHRELGAPIWYSTKGVMFIYHAHRLWLPVKSIVQYPDGKYSVPAALIDTAKASRHLSTEPDTDKLLSYSYCQAQAEARIAKKAGRVPANSPPRPN